MLLALLTLGSCAGTPSAVQKDGTTPTGGKESTTPVEQTQSAPVTVETFTTFDTYGMRIVSCSPKEGVDEGTFVLSSTTPMKIIADMKIAGATDSQQVDVVKEGATWRVSAYFPTTGIYQVRVFAKADSDTGTNYYGSVYVTFTAAVAGDQKIYSLGADGESQKIRLTEVKTVAERWEPYPGTSFENYETGLLAKDADIPFQGGTIRLTKNTPIRFEAYGASMGGFAVAPDHDVPVTISGVTTQFAAAGMIYVGSSAFAGTLKADVSVVAGLVALACTAGSLVFVDNGKIASVQLSQDSMISFRESSYSCKGEVSFSDWGAGRFTEFVLARPVDIAFGPTVATCPAGTKVLLADDRVSSIDFSEDSTISVKGKPMAVKSGWTVSLDAKGNVKDTSIESGGF